MSEVGNGLLVSIQAEVSLAKCARLVLVDVIENKAALPSKLESQSRGWATRGRDIL